MHRSATTKPRLFVTFAAGDIPLVRPLTSSLQAAGGLVLDDGVCSSPLVSPRGAIIRSSLLARLRHCSGALCLYGPSTLDDDWVVWALTAAHELRLPLLGAAIPGQAADESARLLAGVGVELVPLRSDVIAERTCSLVTERRQTPVSGPSIAETLHFMRHPLR